MENENNNDKIREEITTKYFYNEKDKKEDPTLKKKYNNLTRRYVYLEIFDEVMSWGVTNVVVTPNNKNNFPFFLSEYIAYLKGLK